MSSIWLTAGAIWGVILVLFILIRIKHRLRYGRGKKRLKERYTEKVILYRDVSVYESEDSNEEEIEVEEYEEYEEYDEWGYSLSEHTAAHDQDYLVQKRIK